jgi:hypothetical protein
MEHKLVDGIMSLLRQDGFEHVTRQKSSVSQTLAAQQGDLTVVVHISKGGTIATSMARPHAVQTTGLDVAVKATLPGLHGATGIEALRSLRQGGAQTAPVSTPRKSTQA